MFPKGEKGGEGEFAKYIIQVHNKIVIFFIKGYMGEKEPTRNNDMDQQAGSPKKLPDLPYSDGDEIWEAKMNEEMNEEEFGQALRELSAMRKRAARRAILARLATEE